MLNQLPLKIQTKLLIAFAVIGFVPFLFISFAGYLNTLEILEFEKAKFLDSFSRSRAELLTQLVNEKVIDVIGYSGFFSEYKDLEAEKKEDFKSIMDHIIKTSGLKNPVLISPNKKLLYGKVHPEVLKSLSPLFTNEFKTSGLSLTSPYSVGMGVLITPIKLDKKIRGWLLAELTNEEIINIFRPRIPSTTSGEIILGNFNHSRLNYLTKMPKLKKKELQFGRSMTNSLFSQINPSPNSNLNYTFMKDYNNEKVMANFLKMPYFNWVIITKIDEAEIFLPAEEIKEWIIIILFVTLGLVLLYSAIGARSLSGPIIYLKQKMSEAIEKDMDIEIKTPSKDEIGSLASSFKEMIISLKDSRFALQESLVQRSQFIHVLCHDLKNPVGAAVTMIDLMKTRAARNDGILEESKLNKVDTYLKHSIEMMDQIRELMAVDSGKLKVKTQPKKLLPLVEESLSIIDGTIQKKGIILKIEVDQDLKAHVNDNAIVNNILNNLLTNAIKFSPQGGELILKVFLEQDKAVIQIKDSGIGMPKEILDNVFDPKATTSRPGTDGEKGTGFGMPLVKKFVLAHEGTIQIESKEKAPNSTDHGTTVTVFLNAA